MDEWVRQIYKSNNGFGNKNIANRRETANELRKNKRESLLNKRRNIPLNMSPMTPKDMEQHAVTEEPPKKTNNRLEMLKKWKVEKEKKKLELKKNQKPLFKWSRVEHKDDFNTALNYIKGKKIPMNETLARNPETPNRNKFQKNALNASKPSSSKSIKATVNSVDGKYLTRTRNLKNDTQIAGPSGSNSKKTLYPTFKNSSGTVKISTVKEDKNNFREPKPSSKHLKFDGSKNIVEKISTTKDKVQSVSKNKKTPSRILNDSGFSTPNHDVADGNTASVSLPKSSKKPKTPKILNNSGISSRNMNTPNILKIATPRSLSNRRNTRSCSNVDDHAELIEEDGGNNTSVKRTILNTSKTDWRLVKNDGYLDRSTKKSRSLRKSLAIKMAEENAPTPKLMVTSWNSENLIDLSGSISTDDLLDNVGTSRLSLSNASKKQTPRKILNNSKVSTPNLGVKRTPRNITKFKVDGSATRKSRKNSMVPSEEGERVQNSSIVTDRSVEGKEEENLIDLSESISRDNLLDNVGTSRLSPSNASKKKTPRKILNNTKVSTPNLGVKRTPRSISKVESSATKKSRKNLMVPSEDTVNKGEGVQNSSIMTDQTVEGKENEIPEENGKLVENGIDIESTKTESFSEKIAELKTPRLSSSRNAISTPNITSNRKLEIKTPRSTIKQPIRRSSRSSTLNSVENDQTEEKLKTPRENRSSAKKLRKSKDMKISEDGDFFTPNKTLSEVQDDVFTTPTANNEPVVYISPFVTTSRGKSRARREFEMRKSMDANTSLNMESARSPKAAAAYFTRLLNLEIEKIREKCNTWQEYKESGNLSEDACGLIDMTIGQSNLLISKKFNQFRGLIEKCRANSDTEMRITCEDLHGFWDMIYKQVKDLNKRFENLEEMKKNNWLEEAPIKTNPKKGTNKRRRIKSAPTSSLLKETILAARRKMAKKDGGQTDELEICIMEEKSDATKTSKTEYSTPGKGILKTENTKSEKRKTVAFQDVRSSLGMSRSAKKKNTPHQPMRRSLRLNFSPTQLNFN